jgi:hypothetical protein
MPYTTVDLHEIEAEIMDLKRLLVETQRKLQLQESRITTMTSDLNRMTALVAQIKLTS